ncbi:MED6 mediator subfamily complex component-domain-containing protein, partial [Lipomyces oligophaga]|uniref:MED6 mediator subfamily complex component-domain-containing protein n=1 Tax=Lipomyces oligophaga TaxID=45792 RepID=UPI0034CDE638
MTEKQPLDELQWRAPEWIAQWGLRTDNVLDYFAQSPFYDRSSNNQTLKMQSQFNAPMMQLSDITNALEAMRGVEFAIVKSNPSSALWVIRKQERLSPSEVVVLATYFVIEENIYMAPAVYSVLSSRLMSCARDMRQALVLAADKLPNFSPTLGYSYGAIAHEDEDRIQQRVQDQMVSRALSTAMLLEKNPDNICLDAPKKKTEQIQ